MKFIAGVHFGRIVAVANAVLYRFLPLPDNPKPENTGAYLILFSKTSGQELIVIPLGTFPIPEKAEAIYTFSNEKALRLFSNAISNGHISSYQSRDVDNKKYAGAITAPQDSPCEGRNLIGSISGLPELGDEAVALLIFHVLSWITLEDARKVVEISDNPFFQPLYKACEDLLEP
jgi:hypothetical protein